MKVSRILLVLAGLAALPVLSACAAPATAAPNPQGGPIPGTWVDVEVDGDTVNLPLALVEQHVNTHFSLQTGGREVAFMAYILDGTTYVRANACPPCRSRGFALDGNILVCDACATKFEASDGSGIEGACVNYPKAAVQHDIVDGAITMSLSDLVNAYDETLVEG